MESYVYVLDFGSIRKYGYTCDLETRIKHLSNAFPNKPLRIFYMPVLNGRMVEKEAKKSLGNFAISYGGFTVETVRLGFSDCIKTLVESEESCIKMDRYQPDNREKFTKTYPTSARFSRDERKRIWALTPNLSDYVKRAAIKQLEADEKRLGIK